MGVLNRLLGEVQLHGLPSSFSLLLSLLSQLVKAFKRRLLLVFGRHSLVSHLPGVTVDSRMMSIALFHLVFDVLFMLGLTARRAVLVSQEFTQSSDWIIT